MRLSIWGKIKNINIAAILQLSIYSMPSYICEPNNHVAKEPYKCSTNNRANCYLQGFFCCLFNITHLRPLLTFLMSRICPAAVFCEYILAIFEAFFFATSIRKPKVWYTCQVRRCQRVWNWRFLQRQNASLPANQYSSLPTNECTRH